MESEQNAQGGNVPLERRVVRPEPWTSYRIWFDDTSRKCERYSLELLTDSGKKMHAPRRFASATEARGWQSLNHPGLEETL